MTTRIPTTTKNTGYIATANLKNRKKVRFRFEANQSTCTDNLRWFNRWLISSKEKGFYVGDGNCVKVDDVKGFVLTPFQYDVPVKNTVGYTHLNNTNEARQAP